MKSSELKAQIRACIKSDLDETAQRVWLYIATVPVGAGLGAVQKQLKMTRRDAKLSMAILEEAGLVRGKAGPHDSVVYDALPFRVNKPAKDLASSETATVEMSLSRAALRIFRTYQEQRLHGGHGHWTLTARSRADMLAVVTRLDEHPGVEFKDFLRFAARAYKDFAGFPTPAHLKGDWIWDQWANAASRDKVAAKREAELGHAGKHYADPSWARTALRNLGHQEAGALNDAGILYVYNRAREVLDFDSVVPESDEWREEIMALVGVLKEVRDAGPA